MFLPTQIRDAVLAHAAFCAPEEACGLLAGDADGRLRMVYCLTNARHSPVAYTIEPEEHFRALRHAEANGWELVGAFHSHPYSEAFPSATDRRLAAEPDWIYLIASLVGPDSSRLRGYFLRNGTVEEEPLEMGE